MVLLESCDRLLNGEVKCIQPGRERFSLYAPRPDKQVCECEHSGLKNKKPAYTPLREQALSQTGTGNRPLCCFSGLQRPWCRVWILLHREKLVVVLIRKLTAS